MEILITRPRAQAEALAQALEARGHHCLVEPMLTIERLEPEAPNLDDVQALVLTSTNAAPSINEGMRELPVFAVGRATAKAAQAAGCERVLVADGDGEHLAQLLVARCRPDAGALLHVCGTEVRAGMGEHLTQSGYEVRRHPVYKASVAADLSQELQDLLEDRRLDAVLLFSPRTATIFVDLIAEYGFEEFLDSTDAVCLSGAIARLCRSVGWRSIRIAHRPDQMSIVDLLDGVGRRC